MSKLEVVPTETKKTEPKKAVKSQKSLQQKIEAVKKLEDLVYSREIFTKKHAEAKELKAQIEATAAADWHGMRDLRVSLESGEYHPKAKFSFSQKFIVMEFLNFLDSRISEKLKQIDEEILNVEL